jgi:hypothetical protein
LLPVADRERSHALADCADKIDQHKVAAAPADLQTERKRALGVERKGHGRLPDPAALRRFALEKSVGLEMVHDRRGGLDGKASLPRGFDFREMAVATHQRENQSLVVDAHACLIGAACGPRR